MSFLRLFPLTLALLLSFSACNKAEDCDIAAGSASQGIAAGGCVVVDPCAQPCEPDVVCTMDFRSVNATVQFPPTMFASVDSFVVTDLAGTPLPPINGQAVYSHDANRLTIVSDAWVQGHQGMQMPVQAKGYRANGTLLFDQAYTIGADCCHVYKAAGPDVIAVN